ncbi:acyltransferase family protein [Bradyrhizobium sp.]|uniref:acyltransferase family protein n=1 Tax=Bradyrhizobium sp. TaxID=376 RepID=UPI001D699D67|nr:acyltransferase family protein [Bradyrhizobium sp.]MBI5323302.1 acyltransferase [Bradyrhizobium sp.]
MSLPSSKYRPDVDGLRAIAVMLVLNFHAFSGVMPGGFVGVDVFFVISGFLITGIIARELEQGQFSLLTFYVRRIRRIFPALLVVLAASLVLGWVFMLPAFYARLGLDVFASAGFLANIALLLQSGYFDLESARKPLLHLWSLGIEEQFYLAWPLILMLAARRKMSIVTVAAVLGIASFVLNVALIGSKPVAAFYLPFTRAFELLLGAVLACSWDRVDQGRRASDIRAWTGAAMIAASAALLDGHSAFPGWWAILPVAGTALLVSAPEAWICRAVLASPPLVWIGLISYPLYLWHWPLLVFGATIKFQPLTLTERELVLLLSTVLAWATYAFIEKPIRFGAPAPRKLWALCAGMALVGIAGGVVALGRGFDFRLPAEIRAVAAPGRSPDMRYQECLLDLAEKTDYAADCAEPGRRPLLLVWGDSTAGALMHGLRKAQQTRNFAIAQFTAGSCLPALNADIPGNPNCRPNNDRVLGLVRELKPDIVLLHGTWERHLDNVAESVTALKQAGARVVVLGPVPFWRRGLQNEVLRHYMLHQTLVPARLAGAAASDAGYDDVLRKRLTPLGAEIISVREVLCNAEGCLTRLGDSAADIVAIDQVHLSEKGSEFLIGAIIDRVLTPPPGQK